MPRPARPWNESFRIRSYEVTPHGRASLQSVCNYFQEVASNHAEQLGLSRDAMLGQGRAWVLMRLRVQVDHYPEWQEQVQVETWPSGIEGLFATREFLLRDTADVIAARGTSAWAVIDVERRRPVRVPDDLYGIEPPERERPITFATRRIPTLDRVDHTRHFDVRFSDLDLNQHVNNVRYVEWALEAAPEALLRQQQPVEVDIEFRAETTFGQTVVTELQQENDRILHRVRCDGRTVALALTRWTSHS